MPPRKASAIDAVAGTIKPPISFKEFSKDPVKGMLFIVLIAIGYLYVDIKMSNKEMAEKQDRKISQYEVKVDTLQNQVKELINLSATEKAKNDILYSLKKINN
jgi:F0F1-type ATP synthase membrane subunit a